MSKSTRFFSTDSELPPCFAARCQCGWQGRYLYASLYVRGACCPIEDSFDIDRKAGCPKCNAPDRLIRKIPERLITPDAFIQRMAWYAAHFYDNVGRQGDVFPCTCEVKPPCDLDSKVWMKLAVMGDTCFSSDRSWVRLSATFKCRGCHATGKVIALEHHNSRVFWTAENESLYSYLQNFGMSEGIELC